MKYNDRKKKINLVYLTIEIQTYHDFWFNSDIAQNVKKIKFYERKKYARTLLVPRNPNPKVRSKSDFMPRLTFRFCYSTGNVFILCTPDIWHSKGFTYFKNNDKINNFSSKI